MVFVASIIRHKLCMIYAFLDFFCLKIIFDQKLSSYCCDKFDYRRFIAYMYCYHCFFLQRKNQRTLGLSRRAVMKLVLNLQRRAKDYLVLRTGNVASMSAMCICVTLLSHITRFPCFFVCLCVYVCLQYVPQPCGLS